LPKGREFNYKADLLKRLGASVLVAGDQAVEDHLAYMKKLADAVGAELREPLWERNPREILLEEVRHIDFVVIGAAHRELICREVNKDNVLEFLELLGRLGVDPIGERGEYHSQVVRVGDVGLEYRCGGVVDFGGYYIAKLL
jgi:diphthamide synthase (EF-2-diphthine--ammonia ligase)